MAYQIKQSIQRMLTMSIGLIGYGLYVLNNTQANNFMVKDFGLYILLIVPILIVLEILGKILFDILNKTEEKKEAPKEMDEFDRIIEYKSVRNFAFTFLFGLFLSFLFMLILNTLYVPFLILFCTFFFSGYVLQVSYIIYYTNGV